MRNLYLKAKDIAVISGGELIGDSDAVITGLERIETAGKGDLCFIADKKYLGFLENSIPSCIISYKGIDLEPEAGQAYIITENPYLSFIKVLRFLEDEARKNEKGIHPTAVIDTETIISQESFIGPNCVIGRNVKIEAGCVLIANIVVEDNVTIGIRTRIYSGVQICKDTIIGENCIIYHGAVIGSEGFGHLEDKKTGKYHRIPQMGNVVLHNYVEIGANTTIDRALIGSTIIHDGVKIDNLVHIAHNCEIGEDTALAAQVGISGSVKIGKRNRFGGQVGLAGHIETTDDVILMAQSGIAKSISKSGAYFGAPAKEHIKAFRIEAVIRQLPELLSDVRAIKKKLGL